MLQSNGEGNYTTSHFLYMPTLQLNSMNTKSTIIILLLLSLLNQSSTKNSQGAMQQATLP